MNNIHEYRHVSTSEVNQSLVRSANTFLILSYVSIYAYSTTGTIITLYTIPAIIYLGITIVLYFWSLRCVKLSEINKERISFRVIGLSGDIISLSIVMSFADEAGTPLFFVYLWIVVANGIRYGNSYLILSTIMSMICFTVVIFTAPTWRSEELFPVAIGLLISLVILPAYVLKLIAKLSDALESEKAANQLKKSFLATVNHELRTPLNSIISLTDLMHLYHAPSDRERMLNMINLSANSQLRIINSILDISQIESSEFKLSYRSFNLYRLIREIQLIMLPQAFKKGLAFNVYIASDCYCELTGAYDQIKQILINLLGNAVKFTDVGHITLSVLSNGFDKTSQNIVFKVSDTGIGITNSDRSKVFKPFSQANDKITRNYEGSGLGISISDELARLMGGTLTLESKLNHGTTFQFSIKLRINTKSHTLNPDNVKIYGINLIPEAQKIVDFYREQGFIIITDIIADKERLKLFLQDPSIVLLYQDDQGYLLDRVIKQIIKETSALKVQIIVNSRSDVNDQLAVTSVGLDASDRELINAINIASELITFREEKTKDFPEAQKKLRILIAEDDPTLQEIYKLVFSRTEHSVYLVNNGHDALDQLINCQFDLAVLDLRMPGMSGIDVARGYNDRDLKNHIPLVLLTADLCDINEHPDIILFDRVLIKPIKPTELLTSIYTCLKKCTDPKNPDMEQQQLQQSEFYDARYANSNTALIDFDIIKDHLRICSAYELLNILHLYDSEVNEQFIKLDEAITKSNHETIHNVLHRLKGTSMSVGAITFNKKINQIDCVLKSFEDKLFLKENLAELNEMHKTTLLQLRLYISDKLKESHIGN